MTIVMFIFWAFWVYMGILLVRMPFAHIFMMRTLDKVSEASDVDIKSKPMRKWEWRWREFESVNYGEVLYKVWWPLRAEFIWGDTNFLDPQATGPLPSDEEDPND